MYIGFFNFFQKRCFNVNDVDVPVVVVKCDSNRHSNWRVVGHLTVTLCVINPWNLLIPQSYSSGFVPVHTVSVRRLAAFSFNLLFEYYLTWFQLSFFLLPLFSLWDILTKCFFVWSFLLRSRLISSTFLSLLDLQAPTFPWMALALLNRLLHANFGHTRGVRFSWPLNCTIFYI